MSNDFFFSFYIIVLCLKLWLDLICLFFLYKNGPLEASTTIIVFLYCLSLYWLKNKRFTTVKNGCPLPKCSIFLFLPYTFKAKGAVKSIRFQSFQNLNVRPWVWQVQMPFFCKLGIAMLSFLFSNIICTLTLVQTIHHCHTCSRFSKINSDRKEKRKAVKLLFLIMSMNTLCDP